MNYKAREGIVLLEIQEYSFSQPLQKRENTADLSGRSMRPVRSYGNRSRKQCLSGRSKTQ